MPKRILMVEDNTEVSGDLLRMNKKGSAQKAAAAFEFDVAETVYDAIEKLRTTGPYHALLLDIILPGDQDGLRHMRELEALRAKAEDEFADRISNGEDEASAAAIKLQASVIEYDEQIDQWQDIEGGLRVIEAIAVDGLVPEDLPVVVITARSDPNLRSRFEPFLRFGRYEWIEKPERLEKIFAALSRLLGLLA